MPATHTVRVVLDEALVTLNRAVGVLRRRNMPIERFSVNPSETAGLARLEFVFRADAAAADRVVQQFHKIIGVRDVVLATTDEGEASS
jgi:acetolactate synthase small subunit